MTTLDRFYRRTIIAFYALSPLCLAACGEVNGDDGEGGGRPVLTPPTSGGTASNGSGGNATIGSGGSATAGTGGSLPSGGAPSKVDCGAIADAGYDLCVSGTSSCEAVFTDSSGCSAVCAAAGLECVGAADNVDGQCAAQSPSPHLPCDSGHISDYCFCGPAGGGSGGDGSGGDGSGGDGSGGDGSGGDGSGGAGSGDPVICEPMGWATRNGRTGGTVSVTGGGSATPVTVKSFSELQSYASGDTPRVIYVDGPVGSGWSGRSGDRLSVGSNKTIVGLRPGTQLHAVIHVKDSKNVIIRNLVIKGPGSNSEQAWDNLSIEGSSKNIWIDHCEFWDGQDGNADVVKGADNVTFTWNIFGYRTGGGHNFSNLVASSDNEPQSVGKLNITLMFNWFTGVAQRQPRCRYGDIHVVNNLFSRDGQKSDYGISAGKDCRVLTENNHFIEIKSPIYTSHASGSAANEVRGNIFEGTSGNTKGYGTAFDPPYEYEHLLVPATEVKDLVLERAGATLKSPTDCE